MSAPEMSHHYYCFCFRCSCCFVLPAGSAPAPSVFRVRVREGGLVRALLWRARFLWQYAVDGVVSPGSSSSAAPSSSAPGPSAAVGPLDVAGGRSCLLVGFFCCFVVGAVRLHVGCADVESVSAEEARSPACLWGLLALCSCAHRHLVKHARQRCDRVCRCPPSPPPIGGGPRAGRGWRSPHVRQLGEHR